MLNKKTFVVAAVLGAVVACSMSESPVPVTEKSGPPPESSLKAEKTRNQPPPFELKDVDGKTVKLSDYKGKVVLLNFWATWCAPCKLEIPWFEEFQTRYKDKGFEVLG